MVQTSQTNEVDMLQHRLATPVIQPRMYFFDKDKKPLTGGKVYSFKVGEDIFKPTYRNSEFTAANQNPILLDQAGSALIYVRGSVQLKIYDKSGVFIEEKIVYQQQMRTQFFDKYGKALGSGKVWTYDYQSTIKKPSYENADDALLNPNPVILDENGWASISMVGAYRLRQYDKNDVFMGDQDFKRLPVKALTSRVYPIYHAESVQSEIAIKDMSQLTFGTLEQVESSIAISSLILADTTAYREYRLDPEQVKSSIAINSLQLSRMVNYVDYSPKPEQVKSSISIQRLQLKALLISTKMETESVKSSIAITSIKVG